MVPLVNPCWGPTWANRESKMSTMLIRGKDRAFGEEPSTRPPDGRSSTLPYLNRGYLIPFVCGTDDVRGWVLGLEFISASRRGAVFPVTAPPACLV